MDRREFIKTCSLACISGISLSIVLPGCGTGNYFAKNSLVENNRLAIAKSEFVSLNKGKVNYRKYILMKIEKLSFPVCVFRQSDNEYNALLMQCTHKGCELQPQGSSLICPCHGSEFSNKGIVQNPPAEENLKTFKVDVDNEYIYIRL